MTTPLPRPVTRVALAAAVTGALTFAWRAAEAVRIVGGTGALPSRRRRGARPGREHAGVY